MTSVGRLQPRVPHALPHEVARVAAVLPPALPHVPPGVEVPELSARRTRASALSIASLLVDTRAYLLSLLFYALPSKPTNRPPPASN